MRKSEKINRLFNRINQEFFISKNYLMTCESIEQAQSVSDWMADINNKWNNWIDMACKDMTISDRHGVFTYYTSLTEAMAKEWKKLCDEKVESLVPPQQEGPKYPKVVKFKGFC